MKHHIIYVPGLGDHRSYGQPLLLNIWRLFGLTPHFHVVNWADGESLQPKLMKLINLIEKLKSPDNQVSLVGVSAGASAVLTTFLASQGLITGVVCISGKIQNGKTVGERVYLRNPAFRETMDSLPKVLDVLTIEQRRRILSIHPIRDLTVPPADTVIPDAKEKQVPAFGHIQSIFYCLLFSGPSIASFLKNLG